MTDLEQAARLALERLKKLDQRSGHPNNREAIAALEAALAQHAEPVQAEPVAIPGAIPMADVAARSRAMPDRAEALERARERLKQAEPDPPFFAWKGCRVCGLGAEGRVTGYVCPRGDCPTQVRSGT